MKNELDISIIIPCYNVSSYISDCLDSIVKQNNIKPKQVICIDDGSIDDTAEIIKTYEKNYDYIEYVYQENAGVSAARNSGVKLSNSTFLFFVDPDDVINRDSLSLFYNIISQNDDLDFLYYNKTEFSTNKELIEIESDGLKQKIKIEDFSCGISLLHYLLEKNNYTGVSWRYIFRKTILKEYFFGHVYEDNRFSLSIISSAKKSIYLDMKLYFYREREGSLMHSKRDRTFIDEVYKMLSGCFDLSVSLEMKEETKFLLYIYLRNMYIHCVAGYLNGNIVKKENKIIFSELNYLFFLNRVYIRKNKRIMSNLAFLHKNMFKGQYTYHHFLMSIKLAIFKKPHKHDSFPMAEFTD